MTGTLPPENREGFTPPLPHDPPPPPGYVDPLERAEALADLTVLMRGGARSADEGPAPTT